MKDEQFLSLGAALAAFAVGELPSDHVALVVHRGPPTGGKCVVFVATHGSSSTSDAEAFLECMPRLVQEYLTRTAGQPMGEPMTFGRKGGDQ